MEFIKVNTKIQKGITDQESRQSSLGISEKSPNVITIVGGLKHSSDVFLDKDNSLLLIQYLEEQMKTMDKYHCKHHGDFEANLKKCGNCQLIK